MFSISRIDIVNYQFLITFNLVKSNLAEKKKNIVQCPFYYTYKN